MQKTWIYVCLLGLLGLLAGVRSTVVGDIIFNGKTPVCLGTIVAVAKKKVTMVTAAHCVRGASNLSVMLGGNSKAITQTMIHPFYKPPNRDYDIAVLKIELEGTELKEASLLVKEDKIPKELFITEFNGPQNLTEAPATKEERQACQSKHGSKIRISTKMICAQSKSDAMGGSPLYGKEKKSKTEEENVILVGVASYSVNSSLPKIFTNIANSEIYKFIDQFI